MKDEKNNINTIDSKLKTTFAVFVIFVLMAVVAVVFLGIEIPSQDSTQKKQPHVSDIESPIPKLVELVEELETQGSSFLEKTKTATIDESQVEQELESESNRFSKLSCDELSDIASSFEDR